MAMTRSDKPVDLCGMSCPFVLAAIDEALEGDAAEVEIICDHPTTVHETVPAYCRSHGYKLEVQPEIYPLDRQCYRLRICR
jgi:TusA-related sulfurtransferase